MMKDNHVAGEGNAYYTLFREYDPDLGRWWRPDPIFQPWQSPYSAFDGNPIMLTDVWGLEAISKPVIVTADRIKDQTESERYSALSAYYMNEARLFWSGYGLPNQVIPIASDNSQNSILASTQAKSKNIDEPPASQVPKVRGKKRANTTISTPNASGNTITIDDNLLEKERSRKKNYEIYKLTPVKISDEAFSILAGISLDQTQNFLKSTGNRGLKSITVAQQYLKFFDYWNAKERLESAIAQGDPREIKKAELNMKVTYLGIFGGKYGATVSLGWGLGGEDFYWFWNDCFEEMNNRFSDPYWPIYINF